MSTIIAPDEALLSAVVEQVWGSMLHQPVLPWPSPWPRGRAGLLAEVVVTGDCNCTVRLWCADSAAVSMTRVLLNRPDGTDPETDDVEDAIGEVLNVVTGGLKGALGGASSLGLPRVAASSSSDLAPDLVQLALSWHDDPVLISISSSREPGAAPLS